MSDETHSPKDDLRDALRRSIELADRHRPPPCPACAENRELVEAAERYGKADKAAQEAGPMELAWAQREEMRAADSLLAIARRRFGK